MMAADTRREIAEANRRRYEELRAAGQDATTKACPIRPRSTARRSRRTP